MKPFWVVDEFLLGDQEKLDFTRTLNRTSDLSELYDKTDKKWKLVDAIANHPWQPSIAYTCDIALTGEGNISIIEINSFSGAGWYKCDKSKIIRSIAEADKKIAAAHGEAESAKKRADGNAYAISVVGKATADSNALVAKSITPEIIQYTAVQNWKGESPTTLILGKDGAIPFLNVPVK